ncbi:MAG: hypothetical protein E7301_09875 [Butyrivibrio sp.]|nr:hypothetical protein [Butyrivibrio sp.]
MKRITHFFITFLLISMTVLSGCGQEKDTAAESGSTEEITESTTIQSEEKGTVLEDTNVATVDIAIGTTGYIITVPSDYYGADVTEEERRDDMIAYYKSDEHLMDFDVYQFPKEGQTLNEYTAEEAHQYGAETFERVFLGEGDIDATLYYSEEEYRDVKYKVANFIFETTTEFGELVFWLDGDDAEELVDDIISTLTYTGESYDMIGKVLDKLPEDEYYNHYNVKGDNDEIYICNYNGEGELEEGTWVYIYLVDDGMYNIEVAYELKDADTQPLDMIITNENGVEVLDLAVMLVGDTYNFQIIFANPTSSDQEFDLTKLKVENYDGTEIKVFTVNETPKIVGAGIEYSQNAYTISDPGNLSLGDEVSFYYDGAFIYKSVVTEF